MTKAADPHIYCPDCGRPVVRGAWCCPYCGADIAWISEERRLAKEYLRYFSVSVLGGVLLAAAILASLGALSPYATPLVPILVAFAALSVGLWLRSRDFNDSSSPAGPPGRKP